LLKILDLKNRDSKSKPDKITIAISYFFGGFFFLICLFFFQLKVILFVVKVTIYTFCIYSVLILCCLQRAAKSHFLAKYYSVIFSHNMNLKRVKDLGPLQTFLIFIFEPQCEIEIVKLFYYKYILNKIEKSL